MYGFMGLKKNENFFMEVKPITYRDDPWVVNSFAGVTKISPSILQTVGNFLNYKTFIPYLMDVYRPAESTGVLTASFKKRKVRTRDGGRKDSSRERFFAKVIIVVDEDVDVYDKGKSFNP
ncbi:MAG: hypothetical protein Ct9H300mP6_08070 [Gammaproteobacteria bacterium]|nr:MAG: hypothetical protein Ct9H300mP6_08070 [Gammaproteobacteria bacterium]